MSDPPMCNWPPHDATGDDETDPAYLEAEVDRLIASLRQQPAPRDDHGDDRSSIEADLVLLEALHAAWHRARRAITASRIVAAAAAVVWMWGGSAGYGAVALGFTLLAVHQSWHPDVYPERGRELAADIADARERLRKLREGR